MEDASGTSFSRSGEVVDIAPEKFVVDQRKAWEKDQRYHRLSSESGIPKKAPIR